MGENQEALEIGNTVRITAGEFIGGAARIRHIDAATNRAIVVLAAIDGGRMQIEINLEQIKRIPSGGPTH